MMPVPAEQSVNNKYSGYGVVTDVFRRQFTEQGRTEDPTGLKTRSPTIQALVTVLEKVPECESCSGVAPVLDVISEDRLFKGGYSLSTEGFQFWNTREVIASGAPGVKLRYRLFREQGSPGRVVANGTVLRLRRTESQIIVVASKERLEASKEGESRNLIPGEVKLWPLSLFEIK